MSDHYTTLGVAKTATQDEIKKAFRKLASQHHPDKGGDTAKFQEIQAAYDTLGDPAKRAEYDNPRPQFGGFSGGPQFNMHDIFGQMFGGGMGGPFGQHQPRRNHVRMTLWIKLADAARGGSKTVNVGTSTGSTTVEIEIPLGINDGDNVQYGGIAPGGMDLVVQYRMQPDPQWRREDMTLYTAQKVPVWDLIVGGDMEVQTILGDRLTVAIPPRTQPGTTMRVRGQGMRNRNGQAGDMMVQIQGQIPDTIPPEIISAIEQHRA